MTRHVAALALLALPATALTDNWAPVAEPQLELARPRPEGIVCVETVGTSNARPCQPWCEWRQATPVLRGYMGTDGVIVMKHTTCEAYLAEQAEI